MAFRNFDSKNRKQIQKRACRVNPGLTGKFRFPSRPGPGFLLFDYVDDEYGQPANNYVGVRSTTFLAEEPFRQTARTSNMAVIGPALPSSGKSSKKIGFTWLYLALPGR
jgi:hypothetical protein